MDEIFGAKRGCIHLKTQNLWPMKEEDWMIDTTSKFVKRYFTERGDVFLYHYSHEENDCLVEGLLKNLHAGRNFPVHYFKGKNELDALEFIKPIGILLCIDFSRKTYPIFLSDFFKSVIPNMSRNLKLVVVLQNRKYIHYGDISYLLEKSWGINLRNIIVVNPLMKNFHPGVVTSTSEWKFEFPSEDVASIDRVFDISPLNAPALKIFYLRRDLNFHFDKHFEIKVEDIQILTFSSGDDKVQIESALKSEEIFGLVDVKEINGQILNVSVSVTPPYVWLTGNMSNSFGIEIVELTSNRLDGIEILIIKEFRERFNLSGYFIIHPSEIISLRELDDKRDKYGVLEEAALGLSDIAIGGSLPNSDLYFFFEPSAIYLQDDIHWYVPGAKPIPRWKNFYLIFNDNIWYFLAIVHVIVSVAAFIIVRTNPRRKSKIDFSMALLTVWGAEFSQPLPTNIPDRMRILFLAVLLYGVHICNFYQTGLVTVLHEKYYEPQMMTMGDAKAAKMKICLSGISYDFFFSQNLMNEFDYESNYTVHFDYKKCLDIVAKSRNYMALVPKKTAEYTIPSRYLDENYVAKIERIPERTLGYPMSMYLTKASSYTDSLNFVIKGLYESGIVTKWWHDLKFSKRYKQTARKRNLFAASEYSSIKLGNFAGAFFLLLLSSGVGFLIFLLEIICLNFQLLKFKNYYKILRS